MKAGGFLRVRAVVALSVILVLASDAASAERPESGRSVRQAPPGAGASHRATRAYPVTFQVTNSNSSGLPCHSDGADYEVHGTIAGPPSELKAHKAGTITFLLHGFSTGSFQWDLSDVAGYSHIRAMAGLGQVSLTIDRLGYDASGYPDGYQTCYGAAADVAHQIVQQLRSGEYSIDGAEGFEFEKVVLAGHDTGGYIAQIEAYSYEDIDGLVVMGWADQEYTDEVGQRFFPDAATRCAQGGDEAESGGKGGYVQYPSLSDEEAMEVAFYDAPPEVREAFFARRNKNPCGEVVSLLHGMAAINPLRLREIEIPVLLIFAKDDFIWTDQAGPTQREHFETEDLTYIEYDNAGHFFMFDNMASDFRSDLAEWIEARW